MWSHSLVKTELCKIVCFSCLTSDHIRHRDSYLLHYIDQDNNFRSTVILRSEPGPMQDLGKETVINYVYWLPRQIMHLLAFLFNLSVSELLLSVTQIMHFVRTPPPPRNIKAPKSCVLAPGLDYGINKFNCITVPLQFILQC